MSLRRDAPHIEPLLDQAEFLQALAQRQRDRSAFRNPTKGYLFPVGKFCLLEVAGCEFHRVPFLSAVSAGGGRGGWSHRGRWAP